VRRDVRRPRHAQGPDHRAGGPGGELLNTDLIEDYIGFESIKGWELAQKMAEHAKKFGAEIVTDTVEKVRKAEDGWFDVATARVRPIGHRP